MRSGLGGMILTFGLFEGMEMVDDSILIGQRITWSLISHCLFEVWVMKGYEEDD